MGDYFHPIPKNLNVDVKPKEVLNDIIKNYKNEYFIKPSKIHYLFILFGFIAFSIGLIALLYILNSLPAFSNTMPLNTEVISANDSPIQFAQLNTHYICTGIGNIIINLPNSTIHKRGNFVSLAIPENLEGSGSSRSVTVNDSNSTGILSRTLYFNMNDSPLFIIAYELGVLKWKQIR